MIRLGTYGDAAAVPAYIWDSLLERAAGHTAYTHQAGVTTGADKSRFMGSVGSEGEARAFWSQGWRTFRVIPTIDAIVPGREILCPASEEMGKRTACERCGLCNGASAAKSIAIVAHGAGASNATAVL
jgi:hypothetical protein